MTKQANTALMDLTYSEGHKFFNCNLSSYATQHVVRWSLNKSSDTSFRFRGSFRDRAGVHRLRFPYCPHFAAGSS